MSESVHSRLWFSHQREKVYHGPCIYQRGSEREFARLKVALENLLPEDVTERFRHQILVDHLKNEKALFIADHQLTATLH